MGEAASTVEIDGVSVAAGGKEILQAVDLRVGAGEAVAVIGRSGAGKSTLLRLLNGLTPPTTGRVSVGGRPLHEGDLAGCRRRIGTILQSPALFPHRNVYHNLAVVPRLLGWEEGRTRAAAAELREVLGMPLEQYGGRFPRSLSGGEQQRVSIGRAMITRPPLLLCDEPFSALDPIVRRELQEVFIRLRDRGGVTMLFVTHDLGEALRVGRRLVLLDEGRVVLDAPSAHFLTSPLPLVRQFVEAARLPEGEA